MHRWQLPPGGKPTHTLQTPAARRSLITSHSSHETDMHSRMFLLPRVSMGMGRIALAALLICACLALAAGQTAPASAPQPAAPAPGPGSSVPQVETKQLDAFSRVAACVPFTVLVEPSTAHQVIVDAEPSVHQAITTLIDGSTLLLEASALTTTQQIKVTVGLPASNLSAITARGTGPVIVSPGFSSSTLNINSQGTGSVGVLGVNYTDIELINSGWVTELTYTTGQLCRLYRYRLVYASEA